MGDLVSQGSNDSRTPFSPEYVRGKNMLHKEPTGCLTTKRLMRVR